MLLDGTAKCVGNKINVPSNWADEENIRLTTLHSYGAWEEAIYGGDWSLSDEEKSRARRNHLEVWGGPADE